MLRKSLHGSNCSMLCLRASLYSPAYTGTAFINTGKNIQVVHFDRFCQAEYDHCGSGIVCLVMERKDV